MNQSEYAKIRYDRNVAQRYVKGLATQSRVINLLIDCGMLAAAPSKAREVLLRNIDVATCVVKHRPSAALNRRTAPSGFVKGRSKKFNVIEKSQGGAASHLDAKIRLGKKLEVLLSRFDSSRTKSEKKYHRSEIFKLTGLKPNEIRLVVS